MDRERLRPGPALRRPLALRAGAFVVRWDPRRGGRLVIAHPGTGGRPLVATLPGRAFLAAAVGDARIREPRGHVFVRDRVRQRLDRQTLDAIAADGDAVLLCGVLRGPRAAVVAYSLRLSPVDAAQLRFELTLQPQAGGPAPNRTALILAAAPGERFFGFGAQFSRLDMAGRYLPIVASEQGIGRGLQPLTLLANLRAGAGGAWHSSYAAIPFLLGSALRALCLETSEVAVFDMRRGAVRVELHAARMAGRIFAAASPPELLRAYTAYAGRMRPLPDWVHAGAIVGLQGGTARVRALLARLQARGVPLAAVWLQDWTGRRRTSFGDQLWWNWELDERHYPGWHALRADLAARGVRLLGYVNPLLVDVTNKPYHRRNLFAEAAARGYLARTPGGGPAMLRITDFSAAMIDLTNPAARAWLAGVLREAMARTGVDGWMADFGEGLPFHAALHAGSAAAEHNRYPERWAELNRAVIDADGRGAERLFFLRAAYTRSPRSATLFWLGDQLTSWDAHDGIKSAVIGMLSAGLSGLSLTHSDAGGYTGVGAPLRIRRSRELLLRWLELAALSPVLRTHEGNRPAEFAQVYDDDATLDQLARCARLYRAWGFYRRQLVAEAAATGMPFARHLFLHYPRDRTALRLRHECYLLGAELLVAPVLDPGVASARAYLPAGRWTHLWSGRDYGASWRGGWVRVPAPIGQPGLFCRAGSAVGAQLRANLRAEGLLE
jgi:sulfoquinovosidase